MSGANEGAAATGGRTNKRPRVRADAGSSTVLSQLPLEILTTEILARLPVKTLLLCRSVCKAWRTVISGDLSLVSAHLQRQPHPSSVLIFPTVLCRRPTDDHSHYAAEKKKNKERSCRAMAFYQWEPPPLAGGGLEGGRTAVAGAGAVTTISLVDDMPPDRHHCRVVPHDVLAHCDGLVLVATREGKVHLFNPAARQAVTLPWSPGSDEPFSFPLHQSFGLGRDTRSGAYKAARFFYRWVLVPDTFGRVLTPGMEVFTVGADRRWRELATQPPLPVLLSRTAASFKGSLLWNVVDDEAEDGAAPPGFLRLSLEDETFGVTPAPPCRPVLDYCRCALSELRGELCLVRVAEPDNVLEMWVSQDAVRPRWQRRYAIRDAVLRYVPRPVAMLDDGIVFHDRGSIQGDGYLCHYSFQTGAYKEIVRMDMLRGYHHRRPGASIAAVDRFFVIPYRESMLQLNHVMA